MDSTIIRMRMLSILQKLKINNFKFNKLKASFASSVALRNIESLSPNESYGSHIHASTAWTDKVNLNSGVGEKGYTVDVLRLSMHSGSDIVQKCRLLEEDFKLIDIYKTALKLAVMDRIMYESQRQGRISFYMTSTGEEIAVVSSAAALDAKDVVFTQYREMGAFLWRGFTVQNIMDQCYSSVDDLTKGKQMPIHFSCRHLNMMSISSPIGTQLTQSVGCGYAIKLKNKSSKLDRISVVYYGDGASSQGDTHAALNMASVLKSPVLFICRNNGYAISTHAIEQYNEASVGGLAGRAISYGIVTIRADGNDAFAVYEAISEARKYITENKKPAFVELLTYRLGHHSTSDESSSYRPKKDIENWIENYNPIDRLERYIFKHNLFTQEETNSLKKEYRKLVMKSISETEKKPKVPIDSLFHDVYDKMTPNLKKQQKSLKQHLIHYGEKYPLDGFTQ